MDSGFYAASAGLVAQTQALEVAANNLANLSTAGYLGQQATFRSLLAGRPEVEVNPINRAVNDYGVLGGSRVDRSSGGFAATGNPLDVAVAGPGFLAVQSAQGILYTRDGSFHLNPDGQLVNSEGDAVLGEQGPLTLASGKIVISGDGTISVNGAVAGRLRVAEFAPATALTAEGNATYSAPEGSALPPARSSIRQAMLEDSNVSPTQAVVQLITVQRNTEMLSRVLGAIDGQMNQTAAQELSKV